MFKKCFKNILGGFKAVQSSKLKVESLRLFTKKVIFVLLLSTFIFQLSTGVGNAYDTITNIGAISYTNVAGYEYRETSTGTVNVLLYSGPSMSVTKTSMNIRSGEAGSNTIAISCVPGDTVKMDLFSHNTGDSEAYNITLVDTFPAGVGDPTTNNTGMSYIPGSETCDINGSAIADSISWCTDTLHTWGDWYTYSEAVRLSITSDCTGIRWRWNTIDIDPGKSWIRVRYQWYRNGN